MDLLQLEQVQDQSTPSAILKTLASNEAFEIRLAIANNRNVLAKTLDALAKDENESVRIAVSKHRHTSSKTLTVMITDDSDEVRLNIAQHKDATLRVLTILSMGKLNKEIAQAIIDNDKTQPEVKKKLLEKLEDI